MPNNGMWKKASITFGIVVVFAGVVSGYTEVKLKTVQNAQHIVEMKEDIKEIKKDSTTLKIQNAQILEMVKFLKQKAE